MLFHHYKALTECSKQVEQMSTKLEGFSLNPSERAVLLIIEGNILVLGFKWNFFQILMGPPLVSKHTIDITQIRLT
jgi:hypothetical protein